MSLPVPPANLLGKPLSHPLSHLVLFVFIVQGWPGKEATVQWENLAGKKFGELF